MCEKWDTAIRRRVRRRAEKLNTVKKVQLDCKIKGGVQN